MPDLRFPALRALLSSTTDVIGVRIPVAVIAVVGFVLIWVATVLFQAPRIEASLQNTVEDVLVDSGFARMQANVSGRDVTLTGSVSSPDAGARASACVRRAAVVSSRARSLSPSRVRGVLFVRFVQTYRGSALERVGLR